MTQSPHNPADRFCIHCSYNLHGATPDSTCPECGHPAKDSLSLADFLKNDTARKYWINFSLILILSTLALDITLSSLQLLLLSFGLRDISGLIAGWWKGLWIVLLSVAAYTLFYGITRVNKTGYSLLARSALLYITAILFIYWCLQFAYSLSHAPSSVILSYTFTPLFVLINATSVFLLLYGLRLAAQHSSLPTHRQTVARLAIPWLILTLMIFPATHPFLEHWTNILTGASPQPAYLPFNYVAPPAVFTVRQDNIADINPGLRTDPGPGFFSECLGSAAFSIYFGPNTLPYFFKPQNGLAPTQSNMSVLVVNYPTSSGSFAFNNPSLPNDYLWPELLYTLTATLLAYFFSIRLFLFTLSLRKTLRSLGLTNTPTP